MLKWTMLGVLLVGCGGAAPSDWENGGPSATQEREDAGMCLHIDPADCAPALGNLPQSLAISCENGTTPPPLNGSCVLFSVSGGYDVCCSGP
jgi:hypothetical protein